MFECNVCGYQWESTGSNLFKTVGCRQCTLKRLRDSKIMSHEQFVKDVYAINDSVTILGQYNGIKKHILCKCNICGREWNPPAEHLREGTGCPICNVSKGEKNVAQFLNSMNIKYKHPYSFDDLLGTGGRKLSYDFYVTDYNILIECQGQQHEFAVDYWGGEKQFRKQIEHDKRKREYAKLHNIPLLEIWYWDFNNIESILMKELKIKEKEAV